MLQRFRKPVLAVLLIFCLFILAIWTLSRSRQVPLRRAADPTYWAQVWQGTDRYDPRTGLLQQGDPGVKEIALTIDDGPDPRYGPQIAALLHQKDVPATFFLVGIRVKQFPDVARILAQDGFEIGNHTYDHQRLPALKPHEIANELRLGDQHIAAVIGSHTGLMRPPGVQYDEKTLEVAKSLGYVTVSWTVGARDYEPHSSAWIAQRVIGRTEPGAIILLHQDTPTTLGALPMIIDTLRARGYRFVTISQMLDRLHVQHSQAQHS